MNINSIIDFTNYILTKNVAFSDRPTELQLSFQDPATPIMRGIIEFHNHLMLFIVFIVFFVTYLLFQCLDTYSERKNPNDPDTFTHSPVLEVIWTVIPALILVVVAVPSFALLYSMDEMIDPSITIKLIGHQWYWSYEYCNSRFDRVTEKEKYAGIDFESFIVIFEEIRHNLLFSYMQELVLGEAHYSDKTRYLRNLDVDKRLLLPEQTQIRLLVSSTDVLHSWTVPSFGIKVDACPGRLNQAQLILSRLGTFFGQCSEICGINHGFMPIACIVQHMFVFSQDEEQKPKINFNNR
jgi:cytochrome c oxidase subunit 2